jgi:hypothetical protein
MLDAGGPLEDVLRLEAGRGGRRVAAEAAEARSRALKQDRAGAGVEAADVGVAVDLNLVAAGADVDVEGDRRLDEAREVGEDLAAALSGEVPDEAEAGLRVVPEVVELQVVRARAVGLLVVPAQAEVELDVARDLEVVLDVEALRVGRRRLAARVEDGSGANAELGR